MDDTNAKIFKVAKNPHDMDTNLYSYRNIKINTGITILAGCNGTGKSTMIHNILNQLKKDAMPVLKYNNLADGQNTAMEKALMASDIKLLSTLTCSSEGESILCNVGQIMKAAYNFVHDDYDPNPVNDRWLIFDAIDSGLSVDNIVDLKEVFRLICEDAAKINRNVYIIAAANSYELCADNPCIDITTGKYTNFASYDEYKSFILKCRDKKEQRYAKAKEKPKKN